MEILQQGVQMMAYCKMTFLDMDGQGNVAFYAITCTVARSAKLFPRQAAVTTVQGFTSSWSSFSRR